MGRLTVNVLLSFAQFEREVTSERIRDKIAASKRKGLWVGGPLPLGYKLRDGKLVIVEEEAKRVRLIFRRYLEVTGINELVRDLRAKNLCTKARTLSTGRIRGDIPFGRGTLSHLLRNRFFVGEVTYRGEVLPGEQPAIMDKSLFEAVQQKLSAHQSHKTLTRQNSDHLLKGLLFDDAGHRMIATHATKGGIRYQYYVSQPGLHGEARTAELGSIVRVPAPGIEQTIISALRTHLAETKLQNGINDAPISFDRAALAVLLSRIEVRRNPTRRLPKADQGQHRARGLLDSLAEAVVNAIAETPCAARDSPARTFAPSAPIDARVSFYAIARGRRWLDELSLQSAAIGTTRAVHGPTGQFDALTRIPCSSTRQGSGRRTPSPRHQS
jgi:site-specific DNA recombinase